jgi:hypothetical protein
MKPAPVKVVVVVAATAVVAVRVEGEAVTGAGVVVAEDATKQLCPSPSLVVFVSIHLGALLYVLYCTLLTLVFPSYWERLTMAFREDSIKTLHELDLRGLTELCANVARNVSADYRLSDTAHALRMESVHLGFSPSQDGNTGEAANSLKNRMEEFLEGVPSWMLRGL